VAAQKKDALQKGDHEALKVAESVERQILIMSDEEAEKTAKEAGFTGRQGELGTDTGHLTGTGPVTDLALDPVTKEYVLKQLEGQMRLARLTGNTEELRRLERMEEDIRTGGKAVTPPKDQGKMITITPVRLPSEDLVVPKGGPRTGKYQDRFVFRESGYTRLTEPGWAKSPTGKDTAVPKTGGLVEQGDMWEMGQVDPQGAGKIPQLPPDTWAEVYKALRDMGYGTLRSGWEKRPTGKDTAGSKRGDGKTSTQSAKAGTGAKPGSEDDAQRRFKKISRPEQIAQIRKLADALGEEGRATEAKVWRLIAHRLEVARWWMTKRDEANSALETLGSGPIDRDRAKALNRASKIAVSLSMPEDGEVVSGTVTISATSATEE